MFVHDSHGSHTASSRFVLYTLQYFIACGPLVVIFVEISNKIVPYFNVLYLLFSSRPLLLLGLPPLGTSRTGDLEESHI